MKLFQKYIEWSMKRMTSEQRVLVAKLMVHDIGGHVVMPNERKDVNAQFVLFPLRALTVNVEGDKGPIELLPFDQMQVNTERLNRIVKMTVQGKELN